MDPWKKEEFIESLPPQFGDRLDLYGALIVSLGNIITVMGLVLQFQGAEDIEEDIGEDGTAISQGGQGQLSSEDEEFDMGIIFQLIGAILITIGDLVSAAGVAIEIEHAIYEEEKVKQQQIEQDKRLEKMENQIKALQREMKSVLRTSAELEKEVVFLRRALYVSYLP